MNATDAIDAAIDRLRHAFDEAREVQTKLGTIEQGLAELELRFWLAQSKDAAIFCIELDRLRAHQRAEPDAAGMVLLQRAITQLGVPSDARTRADLLQTVNQMRIARGKPAFRQANTLAQAEKSLWREMQRRTSISRRLQRHYATMSDLIASARAPDRVQRALPLLGREADALFRLFRFTPISVLWGSLRHLCQLAAAAEKPLQLTELKDYCQARHDTSEQAKSLTSAWSVLLKVSAQIASLQPSHPLPRLLQSLDAFAAEQAPQEEPSPPIAAPATEPSPKAAGEIPHEVAPATPLPSEVESLSRATDNLTQHLREGVLQATPLLDTLESLATRVLEAFAKRQISASTHNTESIDHLCELVDLAASGVEVAASELESVASELESLVSSSQALLRIDDALSTLTALRQQLVKTLDKTSTSNLDAKELDQLVEKVERIKASQNASQAQLESRLFGYLLTRGELHYALRDHDDLRIETHDISGESHPERSSFRDIAEFFPQSVELLSPCAGLAIELNGRHLRLGCDQASGPQWLELSAPFTEAYGFARLADGRSLCVLSAERLLSDCQ